MCAREPCSWSKRTCELSGRSYTRPVETTSWVRIRIGGLPDVEKKSLAMRLSIGLQKRFGKLAPASNRGAGACLRKACCGELRLYRLAGANGLRTRQHVSFVPCGVGSSAMSTFGVAKGWSGRFHSNETQCP